MPYDPVQAAYQWFEQFLSDSKGLPSEDRFGLLAASAADQHVRRGASEVEWMLFTTTFYEAALKLYTECIQQYPQIRVFKSELDALRAELD